MNLQQNSSDPVKLAQQENSILFPYQAGFSQLPDFVQYNNQDEYEQDQEDDDDDEEDDGENETDSTAPADEVNLLQKQQMQFDFISHIKSLGNQILSMFRKKESAPEEKQEEEGNIQIEIEEDKNKKKGSRVEQNDPVKKKFNDDYAKNHMDEVERLVKPMGMNLDKDDASSDAGSLAEDMIALQSKA